VLTNHGVSCNSGLGGPLYIDAMPESAASPQRDLLTLGQVADELGVSKRHVYDLRATGVLKTLRLSRKVVRVRRSDLDAYLQERAS
jgi:excisionase family DNA binding protein